MADSPEQSDHTSIQARLGSLERGETHTPSLANFMGHEHQDKHQGIPFRLMDYIELVDWVGRQIRDDKRGHINNHMPVILERLSLPQQECLTLCTELEKKPRAWVGSTIELQNAKAKLGRKRMLGLTIS